MVLDNYKSMISDFCNLRRTNEKKGTKNNKLIRFHFSFHSFPFQSFDFLSKKLIVVRKANIADEEKKNIYEIEYESNLESSTL